MPWEKIARSKERGAKRASRCAWTSVARIAKAAASVASPSTSARIEDAFFIDASLPEPLQPPHRLRERLHLLREAEPDELLAVLRVREEAGTRHARDAYLLDEVTRELLIVAVELEGGE